MEIWYNGVSAEAGAPVYTPSWTMNLDPSGSTPEGYPVLITCALQQVNQAGSNTPWQAGISITSYIQNGEPNNGSWQALSLSNITSVTFTMTLQNASAHATMLIYNQS